MSASGMVLSLQLSGGELSEQQRHAALDLVGDLLKRGVRLFVTGVEGGGVSDAPVRGDRSPWELRADLAHLVAERDDPVESGAGEAGERLRGATRDVDATLGHDPHRVRVQRP